jgi:hypothetical protein
MIDAYSNLPDVLTRLFEKSLCLGFLITDGLRIACFAVPIGKDLQVKFPTNWELSAVRAVIVVKYLNMDQMLLPAE